MVPKIGLLYWQFWVEGKEVTIKLTFIYDMGNSADIAVQIGYAYDTHTGLNRKRKAHTPI